MARYNIYIFDREGGLIVGYHPFEVSDDAAAVAFAETFSAQRPMELWRDDFLVHSWPAEERQGIA